MRREELEALRVAGALGGRLADQVDLWTPVQQRIFSGLGGVLAPDNVAFLHDPLTVLALFEPDSLHFETLRIATTIERGVLRTREVDPQMEIGLDSDSPNALFLFVHSRQTLMFSSDGIQLIQ